LVDPLTKRECEIIKLIAAGYSNRQIADALVITLNTVKKHTTHIYGKLGVENRTQAVNAARDIQLIS
jgi:LuxR family maltose regulon positive regulatory protein